MNIVVIGVNHTTAPVDLRERLAFSEAGLDSALSYLHQTIGEGVILSTCNRAEVYVLLPPPHTLDALVSFLSSFHRVPQEEITPYLYSLANEAAVNHLFRVASGLESMVLGETEILRQVRQAMDRALEQHTAGPVLAALFRQAVAVGKRVRTETPIARRPASISAAVATIAESVIGPLAGRIILIIGAGHMGTLITKALIKKGARRERMTIASRTYCRARQLAEREGAMAIPLPEVATVLKDADLIVTCTSAPHPILSAADLQRALSQRQGHTMCIIDVAVPRNVDPAAAHVPGANLYDIDDLQGIVSRGREERESALPAAEAIIADAVQDFMAWYDSRRMVPILTALRKKAERIRQQEVDKALGRLGHLSERDRQVVIACSLAITNKLLHDPIMSLKDNAHQDANGTYADIACRLFGLDQLDQSAVEGDPTREHAAATTVRG